MFLQILTTFNDQINNLSLADKAMDKENLYVILRKCFRGWYDALINSKDSCKWFFLIIKQLLYWLHVSVICN